MSHGPPTKCPVCYGRELKYRIGIDALFAQSEREEYDIIKERYDTQIKQDTLIVSEFVYGINPDGTIRIVLYGRCSNCNTVWKTEHEVKPIIGDK